MARARQLSPSFFTDERVVSCCMAARLLFEGLWCESDREGRIEDKPLSLKMKLFPADAVDVKALLDELEGVGLIARYQVSGRGYLLLPNFKRHQHVHPREAPSKLPPPPVDLQARETAPSTEQKPGLQVQAMESGPSIEQKPGPEVHGEGVDPSDPQALGSSGPSDVQALKPSVAPPPRSPQRPVEKEDKNSQWDRHALDFVHWARALDVGLKDPGPQVFDWARRFFRKHQPSEPLLIRAAFAKFLLWCHQAGKAIGWGLWLSEKVWEPRWAEVRADAMSKRGAA